MYGRNARWPPGIAGLPLSSTHTPPTVHVANQPFAWQHGPVIRTAGMKFQVALPGNNRLPGTAEWVLQLKAPDYQELAAGIDWLGFDALSTSEHIVMPDWEVPRLGPYWTHALSVMAFILGAKAVEAAEVNVYSYRQPYLIDPLFKDFTAKTGTKINVIFAEKEWANSVNMLFPNTNDRGTHVNISGAVVAKYAPHKENALRLLEFLPSDEGQEMYALVNNEYPVKEGVPWSPLVKSWGNFKPDPISLNEIAALRKTASELVDKVGFDDGPSS